MTANPNTACKPLRTAQEEHIMHCTVSAWRDPNNAAWKSFHPVIVTLLGIERNCLEQLSIENAPECTFEDQQQALKSPTHYLKINTDKTCNRIKLLIVDNSISKCVSMLVSVKLQERWNAERKFVTHQTFKTSVRKYNLNSRLVLAQDLFAMRFHRGGGRSELTGRADCLGQEEKHWHTWQKLPEMCHIWLRPIFPFMVWEKHGAFSVLCMGAPDFPPSLLLTKIGANSHPDMVVVWAKSWHQSSTCWVSSSLSCFEHHSHRAHVGEKLHFKAFKKSILMCLSSDRACGIPSSPDTL